MSEAGNGNPLQYSYLGNWTEEPGGLSPGGCKESDTTKHLCGRAHAHTHTHTHTHTVCKKIKLIYFKTTVSSTMPAKYSFVSIYTSVMCLDTAQMARGIGHFRTP